ncbi:RNA polymerase sigma factor [Prevotella cerevisiae]|uniref:RNA polymerase sigma factor n=1 Tax=Segatella cerevisiae TaxID=2053716 RepID=A0ABT1BU19_9BACT|nr:RNA polymerase sigma factor [Segatella cerevisiae]MCO6024469.1 RNA polymerase sigma factor [Segatella cerevisiae]
MTVDEFQHEVKRLRPQLVSIARHYISNGDEVEDIVQDVFLKMWLMLDQLKLPVAPLAKVLVRNLAVDHLRRHHSELNIEDVQISVEEQSYDGVERMMHIISLLPSLQQTILRLRHMENMEISEIARLMGSTETAVRKALSRARQAVRKEYYKKYQL